MSAALFAGGPIGAIMDPLLAGLTTGDAGTNSYLPLESLPGDTPVETLTSIVTSHVQAHGNSAMPFSSEIADIMAPLLGGTPMSFINAGDQSSHDALNDMTMHNPFIAMRWPDGSERTLREGVPIFSYTSNLNYTSPGYAVVASPVKVNDTQLKLAELERAVAFHGVAPQVDDPRRMRFRSHETQHAHSAGTGRIYTAPMGNTVDADDLASHRFWGSSTVNGLFSKLSYLGPVLSIHARENGSHSAQARMSFAHGESYMTHAFCTRGRIHNMFSTNPELGEQFYFSLGKYERDDLISVGCQPTLSSFDYGSGFEQYGGSKRAYHSISSAYVTTPAYNAGDANAVVQVRGWASRTGQQWLQKTSPIDSMKPDIADRFYMQREKRAAAEWVDTDVDPQTGELRIRKSDEGAQEAINNLPNFVLENYLDSIAIYPVGMVKGYKNPDSTPAALHNAHYDMSALVSQPLVEIYLSY